MTSINVSERHVGLFGGFGASLLVYGVAGLLAVLGVFGLTACKQDTESAGSGVSENVATIQVISGNGRLAGGEEYQIAQWRGGSVPHDGGYFADFRGQDGGPTIDLTFRGLSQVGEWVCGEAMAASLELRVDVANAYRADPDAPCVVHITRLGEGVIEGDYTATLRHTGNAEDEMTVAGTFRAAQPQESPQTVDIKAAKGPNLGLR